MDSVTEKIQKIQPRDLRDLLNLCAAARLAASSQPYAGGATGRVGDALALLTGELAERANRFGLTEPELWSFFHDQIKHRFNALTMADISIYYGE